uniref:Deoxyuridine 5'-triphosphate nucleotidohydrolase n=1 Tax=Buteo japonicus TaxID=224669 RepID=A0A8B9ZAR7_9AVES
MPCLSTYTILNNRPIGEMETPLIYWEIQDGAVASYRATPDEAGLDLYTLQQYQLNVRDICIINAGIGIQFPSGYFGLIAPRSSLAVKGIQVLGGVIEADYRGEIKVMLLNSGIQDLLIQPQEISFLYGSCS